MCFFFVKGAAGPAHTVHQHLVEHLSDDETRRTHLDPFRNLAADRTVHIRVIRHEAQCRGTQAVGRRAEKETVDRRGHAPDFHHQVVGNARKVHTLAQYNRGENMSSSTRTLTFRYKHRAKPTVARTMHFSKHIARGDRCSQNIQLHIPAVLCYLRVTNERYIELYYIKINRTDDLIILLKYFTQLGLSTKPLLIL